MITNGLDAGGFYFYETYALSLGGGYWLDVASQFPGGGVTRSPAADCYPSGTIVSLTASPVAGYQLAAWLGDASGNANPLGVTMDDHKTIYAAFEPIPTATLLARFEAAPAAGGVELRWAFSDPSRVTSWTMERAEQTAGPLTEVTLEMHSDSEFSIGVDRGADPTRAYWYRLIAVVQGGSRATFGPIQANGTSARILVSDLVQRGNPSFTSLHLDFAVAREGPVKLRIFDVTGREVAVLVDEVRAAGHYSVVWDRHGQHGRTPAGVYVVRFEAADRTVTRRFTLLD